MLHRAFALVCGAAIACALATQARAAVFDRPEQRFGNIATGLYQAGDNTRFTLDRYQNQFLLKFVGQSEVFVLYADFGSLGGRILQYDSGSTAIQIAGWGGMTIYTDEYPDGQPTTRIGDSSAPSLPSVSLQQMQSAADDESSHLAYSRGLHINFMADPDTLSDSSVRALAFDTMENTVRGIDRFTANPAARAAFAQRIGAVRLQRSGKPTLKITERTLIVTFNPQTGYFGRASSRAIAFALGKVMGIPIPN